MQHREAMTKTPSRTFGQALASICVVLWLATISFAQSDRLVKDAHTTGASAMTATLGGTVADESGSMVPYARISVEGVGAALKRQAITGVDGSFTVPKLPAGR